MMIAASRAAGKRSLSPPKSLVTKMSQITR